MWVSTTRHVDAQGREGMSCGNMLRGCVVSLFSPVFKYRYFVVFASFHGTAFTYPDACLLPTACTICKQAPMDQPSEGPCGHVACHGCWMAQITKTFKCAVCKVQVRRAQVKRKLFIAS